MINVPQLNPPCCSADNNEVITHMGRFLVLQGCARAAESTVKKSGTEPDLMVNEFIDPQVKLSF